MTLYPKINIFIIGGGCKADSPSTMSCLVWNCCGLGNLRTVQGLAGIVRSQDPKIVFLIETWSNEKQMEFLRCQLQFSSKLVLPSRGRGGGLCLFWKNDEQLSIHSFSLSHIDAIIRENNDYY